MFSDEPTVNLDKDDEIIARRWQTCARLARGERRPEGKTRVRQKPEFLHSCVPIGPPSAPPLATALAPQLECECLCGQSSAGLLEICGTFQRDILHRHF